MFALIQKPLNGHGSNASFGGRRHGLLVFSIADVPDGKHAWARRRHGLVDDHAAALVQVDLGLAKVRDRLGASPGAVHEHALHRDLFLLLRAPPRPPDGDARHAGRVPPHGQEPRLFPVLHVVARQQPRQQRAIEVRVARRPRRDVHGRQPVHPPRELGQEERLLDGLRRRAGHGHLRVPEERPVARGAVADPGAQEVLLPRDRPAGPAHGARGQDEGARPHGEVRRVDALGVRAVARRLVVRGDVDPERLGPRVPRAARDGLGPHPREQRLARRGRVDARVVGDVGRDGERSRRRILVEDDRGEAGAGGVQGAGAAGGAAADDGDVAFDDFHVQGDGASWPLILLMLVTLGYGRLYR